MIKNLIWGAVVIAFVFTSCGDEETMEKAEYKNGVIVVNQGAFQSGTGTLTFKERGNSKVVQNVFSLSNDGASLGNIAQSMIEHNGKNYISINNGSKIVVTNKDDFRLINTIDGIIQSRFFASDGENLFVSAWGPAGNSGCLHEIDGELNTAKSVVSFANGGPDGMVFLSNYLMLALSGGFGLDSTVIAYDLNENSIVYSTVLGDNPEMIVKDNDRNLYVICNGYTDFVDPSNNTSGRIVKIGGDNLQTIWSHEIPNGSSRLAIDADGGFIYFNMGGNVVKQDINSEILAPKIIRQGTAYALGFDEVEDKLYIADAKDFVSQGEAYVYNTSDEVVDSFATGIIPGYFHFQEK